MCLCVSPRGAEGRAMANVADWHARDRETIRKQKELVTSGNLEPEAMARNAGLPSPSVWNLRECWGSPWSAPGWGIRIYHKLIEVSSLSGQTQLTPEAAPHSGAVY